MGPSVIHKIIDFYCLRMIKICLEVIIIYLNAFKLFALCVENIKSWHIKF